MVWRVFGVSVYLLVAVSLSIEMSYAEFLNGSSHAVPVGLLPSSVSKAGPLREKLSYFFLNLSSIRQIHFVLLQIYFVLLQLQ